MLDGLVVQNSWKCKRWLWTPPFTKGASTDQLGYLILLHDKEISDKWFLVTIIPILHKYLLYFFIIFTGGQVLEVCLAKWWANIGAVKVSYTITFFGITPSSKEIMFHGADGITRIGMSNF